ncbi:MAG: cation:proton antiporter [Bacteroidota bacterium]
MDLHILLNICILFGVTIFVIILCNFFKIPHLIGYLLTGILLSPNSTTILSDAHEVEAYAEIGVILLLFTVGLEFSFSNLKKIQKYVLVGGALQVIFTICLTAVLMYAMGRSIEESVFWGFVIALSSTAIVIKTLQDKVKLNTQYGKVVLAVLLFQDIIIVPLMLFTPILAGEGGSPILAIGILVAKLAGIGILAWLLARWIIPKFLYQIMKIQSQEVFLITTIFIVTGIALLTSWLGLSLALGAFIAGLIIAETDYNRLAISCFLPFRYVFISFFFISMGMLLDYQVFLAEYMQIFSWFVFIIIVKITAGILATKALKLPMKTAVSVGLAIAQIGEFSFVISKSGLEYGLISETNYQIFLSVSILTMALTPFILTNLEQIIHTIFKMQKEKWHKPA